MSPLSIPEFVAAVGAQLPGAGAADSARRVARMFPQLLVNPGLLDPAQRMGSAEDYCQHVLHVDAAGRFSVVAVVWEPGQGAAPHDHVAWCVVGVYQGVERETTFRLEQDGGQPRLVPARVAEYRQGDVTYLVPGEGDIHAVENAGGSTAISIHVYGADIAALGSSIRRRYALVEEGP
jgi:predicted metal-dependent enzyme (double-stranded beta helix superfamily)